MKRRLEGSREGTGNHDVTAGDLGAMFLGSHSVFTFLSALASLTSRRSEDAGRGNGVTEEKDD